MVAHYLAHCGIYNCVTRNNLTKYKIKQQSKETGREGNGERKEKLAKI